MHKGMFFASVEKTIEGGMPITVPLVLQLGTCEASVYIDCLVGQ